MQSTTSSNGNFRSLLAFWIFGFCETFGFILMMSAAQDILTRHQSEGDSADREHRIHGNTTIGCIESLGRPRCDKLKSTGTVLMVQILPSLFMKLTFPFFASRIPFSLRHLIVCFLQAAAFSIVAFAGSLESAFVGIFCNSVSNALAEMTYLALSTHYSRTAVVAINSGKGCSAILSSFIYALLREPKLLGLSSKAVLLSMLIVPAMFLMTWFILERPSSMHRASLTRPSTWIVPVSASNTSNNDTKMSMQSNNEKRNENAKTKKRDILLLLRYVIPLAIVYYTEYLINSGLFQHIQFDCAHGFGLAKASQFRWFQVLCQLGMFLSRSLCGFPNWPAWIVYILALIECFALTLFYLESIYQFIPHITIIFGLTFFEGIFTGATNVITLSQIHEKAAPEAREFSMAMVTVGDTLGISLASISAILVHNHICGLYEVQQ